MAKPETLEKGNLYFFYRPKVERHEVESPQDVQRMYLVFSPENKDLFRLAVIGRKELPQPENSGHQRYWGYILKVSSSPEGIRGEIGPKQYHTKTRGERHVEAARPFGEGVYRILKHGNHTHFVYALELPRKPGEVQQEFNVEDQASYIITIPNPQRPTPPGRNIPRPESVEYPPELKQVFGDRSFSELTPPELLDYEGAQFVLISASEDIKEELGVQLNTEDNTASSADIFTELHLDRSKRPVKPLFRGEWQ